MGHEDLSTMQTTVQSTLMVSDSNLSSMLALKNIGRVNVYGPAFLHINCGSQSNDKFIAELTSDRKTALKSVRNHIGSKRVHRSQLEFSPSRLVAKPFKKTHSGNRVEAYHLVNKKKVPRTANVAGSHIVYKIKHDSEGQKYLKAKLCPQGNEVSAKHEIGKDSNNAPMATIRLTTMLTAVFRFKIII